MTDDNTAADLDHTLLELARLINRATQLATRELQHATWPTTNTHGTGPIDTTPGQSTTEHIALTDHRYRDHNRIVNTLTRAATLIANELDRLTPRLTGHPCIVTACQGDGLANRQGRCWQCADFHHRNRYDPPPATIRAWNARRPRPCQCDNPDCLKMVPPGDGNIHSTCRSRRHRQRHAQ